MKGKPQSPLYKLQNRENKLGKCRTCGKYAELTVDHIFPQSLLVQWGLTEYTYNDGENLELICRPCNVLKQGRFDFHNPKTIPLIEKYIGILKETYTR